MYTINEVFYFSNESTCGASSFSEPEIVGQNEKI